MELLKSIFGEGKDLSVLQMSSRGIVVFIIAFALIRLSGRRSFGMKSPLDNIIVITLGAVLSRAIVGASGFLPVTITCLVIVLLHRVLAWLSVHNKKMDGLMEGKKILLFNNGSFIKENMDKALVCEDDVMEGIRRVALTEDLSKIEKVYMERNGQISVVKK